MSGKEGPFSEDQEVSNFVRISSTETVANSIFFDGIDVEQEYGIVVGDFITTTGASNGANNVSLKEIEGIVVEDTGSYITIDGVTFVEELDSAAVIDFRSKYDVWPSGCGLQMGGDETDVNEHQRLDRLFLSNHDYDLLLFETVDNGKDLLSTEIYNPAAAFSAPRKAKASVGYHFPPLPTDRIKVLDSTKVLNPSELAITRSTSKNFLNSVTYGLQENPLEEGRFLRGVIETSALSIARIPVNKKTNTVLSKGLRAFNLDTAVAENGAALATTAANRKLTKYRFGAEWVNNIKVGLATGWDLEIGDIVLLDLPSLKMSDITTGTRDGESRLFEIQNKVFSFADGLTTLEIVDTNFDKDVRFGLISPASIVSSGISGTQFTIQESYNSPFGVNEFKKWEDYIGTTIKVRIEDPTHSVSGTAVLKSFSGNTVTVETDLGFTPVAGYIMELDGYNTQTDVVQNIYTFMRDSAFDDGKVQYTML